MFADIDDDELRHVGGREAREQHGDREWNVVGDAQHRRCELHGGCNEHDDEKRWQRRSYQDVDGEHQLRDVGGYERRVGLDPPSVQLLAQVDQRVLHAGCLLTRFRQDDQGARLLGNEHAATTAWRATSGL